MHLFKYFLCVMAGIAFPVFGAVENKNYESRLQFGNLTSNIEAYIVTDWLCPICQRVEPALEPILPKLFEQSCVTFVNLPNHPGSMNFTVFDVSFMINNKADYLKIRPILNQIATTEPSATKEQIATELARNHITYKLIDDAAVKEIIEYFKRLLRQYKVTGTPTIVIRNVSTNQQKNLIGNEITEENVMKAVKELRQ